jgi:MinD superfamily P-loop ATPase
MKQLVILSGKGGTGKTSVAAAFAHLSHQDHIYAVLADGDVDAANLELVLRPRRLEAHEFMGGAVAIIDEALCLNCGICEQVCRFGAILQPDSVSSRAYRVDPIACDGCAACVHQCPEGVIHMQPQLAGHWYQSETRFGLLLHAGLLPAQENSGKLVTMVKQQARLLALDTDAQVVIVDGPPGVGCPVISAVSGADLALVVTEATAAGLHDMRRALGMTRHFRIPTLVCINKADIYPPGADEIRACCEREGIEVVGDIPFDPAVTQAMLNGDPVTEYRPNAPASRSLAEVWGRVAQCLNNGGSYHG